LFVRVDELFDEVLECKKACQNESPARLYLRGMIVEAEPENKVCNVMMHVMNEMGFSK